MRAFYRLIGLLWRVAGWMVQERDCCWRCQIVERWSVYGALHCGCRGEERWRVLRDDWCLCWFDWLPKTHLLMRERRLTALPLQRCLCCEWTSSSTSCLFFESLLYGSFSLLEALIRCVLYCRRCTMAHGGMVVRLRGCRCMAALVVLATSKDLWKEWRGLAWARGLRTKYGKVWWILVKFDEYLLSSGIHLPCEEKYFSISLPPHIRSYCW